MQYREITGLWSARVPDGPDSDQYPDTVLLEGRVTFEPEYRVPLVYPGEHIVIEPMHAVIHEGVLYGETVVGDDVARGPLFLPVTVDENANQTWAWVAKFQGMRLGEYGEEVTLPNVRFQVPAGGDALDLSAVIPVSQSGGTITLRGPAGPGLTDITPAPGTLTFVWDDGRERVIDVPDIGGVTRDEDGRLTSTPLGGDIFFDDLGDLVATASDAYLLGQELLRVDRQLFNGTGVRNLTGMVSDATGGQVLISRRGPVVELALVNLLLSGAAAWGTLLTLPLGFQPALPAAEAALIPQGASSGVVSVRRSDGRVDINRLGPTVRHKLTFTYTTADPWPTVLPGTPA